MGKYWENYGKNNRIKIGYLKHDILIFLKNILEKIKYPQFLYNWACFYSHAISIYFLKYMR